MAHHIVGACSRIDRAPANRRGECINAGCAGNGDAIVANIENPEGNRVANAEAELAVLDPGQHDATVLGQSQVE